MVEKEIRHTIPRDRMYSHEAREVLNTKFSSQVSANHVPRAQASTVEMPMCTTTFLNNRTITLEVLAPTAFRIPISFVRCSVVKEVSPNNPRLAITIARKAKERAIKPVLLSSL